MMMCLCMASLLVAQRGTAPSGGNLATDTANVGEMRQVTPGYLRTKDPGFVARVLQRADTPDGRRVAATLVTPEMLYRRESLLAANRDYLRGVAFTRPLAKGERPVRPKPEGSRPKEGDKPVIGQPVKMPPGGPKEPTDVGIDLGTFMQSDSESGTGEYYGTARHAGTLTVKDTAGTAIDVQRVDLLTGEVKDGKPVIAAGSGSGSTFHVEEGQEFVIRFRLDLSKSGVHKEDIILNKAGTPLTVHLQDEIAEAKGGFSCHVVNNGFYVVPGTSQQGTLHLKIKGNTPTTIHVSGSGPSGVTLHSTTKSVKAQDEVDVPFTVSAPAGAPNVDGLLTINVSGFSGSASVALQRNIRVETVWSIAQDYQQSAGKGKTTSTFKFSSAGDWEYAVNVTDSSSISDDYIVCLVSIDRPLPNNHHLER